MKTNYKELKKKVMELKERVSHVYIYGYGIVGRNIHRILEENNVHVDGFVVTKRSPNMTYNEIVLEAKSCLDLDTGFIIALNELNTADVLSYLAEQGIPKKNIINTSEFMIGGRRIHRTGGKGSFEVTTAIGCPVACHYCPQEQFLSVYFHENINRTLMADLSLMKHSLEYFPQHYDVSFGGMSEPFLNEECMDMLEMACKSGRNVFLYTTLVGVKKEYVPRLLSLPLGDVIIHVADAKGYANIPLTDEYFDVLERIVCGRRPDGSPFVSMCNAQAAPHEKVDEIIRAEEMEVFYEVHDRAGTLQGNGMISNRIDTGPLQCWNFGGDWLNCELLPDGTIVLCCMDWEMKHVLGNIYEQSFEEIMEGEELAKVRAGMAGDSSIDILCRRCSFARSANLRNFE